MTLGEKPSVPPPLIRLAYLGLLYRNRDFTFIVCFHFRNSQHVYSVIRLRLSRCHICARDILPGAHRPWTSRPSELVLCPVRILPLDSGRWHGSQAGGSVASVPPLPPLQVHLSKAECLAVRFCSALAWLRTAALMGHACSPTSDRGGDGPHRAYRSVQCVTPIGYV